MKSKFIGYYRLGDAEFETLLSSAVICIDANVLLNLYRYSSETRDRLLNSLSNFGDRLWIPHQAALEFHKNRVSVIYTQLASYAELRGVLEGAKKELSEAISKFSRHAVIDVKELEERIERHFSSLLDLVSRNEKKHPDFIASDSILNRVTDLFEGRVGEPYDEATLNAISKEGEKRFSEERPPGYKDAKAKSGSAKYGDYIVWRQIIDKAQEASRAIIFVTDDLKQDWWQRVSGKTIGPRPELIEEFRAQTGQVFYMYRPEQFVKFATKSGAKVVPESILEEMKSVRKRRLHTAVTDESIVAGRRFNADQLIDIYHALDSRRKLLDSKIAELKLRIQSLPDGVEAAEDDSNLIAVLSAEVHSLSRDIHALYLEITEGGDSISTIERKEGSNDERLSRLRAIFRAESERGKRN